MLVMTGSARLQAIRSHDSIVMMKWWMPGYRARDIQRSDFRAEASSRAECP